MRTRILTGDIVFTTDNDVIVENSFGGNPITYSKKPTEKKYIDTKDLYKADLLSFDSKIGYITNGATELFAMLSLYDKDSKEYKAIMHRMKECRVLQGNEIDKAKGLIVKPYPAHWVNWQNPNKPNEKFTKEEIEFNNKLLIDKRPYFMRHLYPAYKAQYKNHREKYEYLCNRQYGIGLNELLSLENKNEEQENLVNNYNKFNPFLETDCVMNNICKYMEKEVKEIKINVKKKSPDYIFDILFNKDIEMTQEQIDEMEKVYKKYKKQKSKSVNTGIELENNTPLQEMSALDYDYISDDIQRLANLAVYINYYLYPNSPKDFCWNLFGDGIVLNIYDNSNKNFKMPLLDNNGEIEYMGKNYSNKKVEIECQ